MTKADFKIEIDWNNDGDWSDSGEDVTARVLNHPGIVTVRGRDQVRALAPPMAGTCEFALNNASRDYSPDNAGGPLYGNLVPGRAVRVRTTAPSAATLWSGHLDDLPQEPFVVGGGRVRAPALGKLAKLKGVVVSTARYQNVTTSAALTTLFAAAGLAAGEYTMLDTGKTTLTTWWCDDDDAFQMMGRLLAAEGPGAAIYEQADGKIAFHSRHYRLLTARSTTSQATFGNASTEPKHSPPLGYEPGLKGVVNSAALVTKTYVAGAVGTLGQWSGEQLIMPGETFTVRFRYATTSDASGFEWTQNPPVGSGNDLTAIPSEDYANGIVLGFRNDTLIPLRLYTITVEGYDSTSTETPVVNSVSTATSRAKYGTRTLPSGYNPWPYISQNVAQDFCNAIVQAYQEPRPTVAVTVNNANSTRLTQQLTREISDRVTVVETQTGLNADLFVEQIRHEVAEGGRFHRTILGCEKAGTTINYGIWGTSTWGGASWGF